MSSKCKIRSAVRRLASVVFFVLLASVVCRPSSVCAADATGIPSSLNARLVAAELAISVSTNDVALHAATNALNTLLNTTTGNVGVIQGTLATATGNVAVIQGTLATATGNVATLQGQIVAQADTNATTTATLYTPRFVGDTLVGGAGVGTNAVWVAKGATTNDWVAIAP